MVVTSQDALQRARLLPSDVDMAIDGLTAEEWEAFKQALADAQVGAAPGHLLGGRSCARPEGP